MALDADTLVDRRRLKRHLNIWRTLAIVIAVGAIAAAVGRFTGLKGGDYVSRLTIANLILHDTDRIAAIQRIADDENARALIVQIDSPGGTVVGGEALYQALRKVAANKPVVAVLGQVATSAGYMVAVASDYIIARKGTITGSIGVIMQTTDISGLLKKLGITAEAIRSGSLKALPSPFEPMTPEVRQSARALVDDVFSMFRDLVAKRRQLSPAEIESLSDGRVFSGQKAQKLRLVDAIGGETEARKWLESVKGIAASMPARNIRDRRSVEDWVRYVTKIAQKTLLSERLTLDGLISVWQPAVR
jgi:protease-4